MKFVSISIVLTLVINIAYSQTNNNLYQGHAVALHGDVKYGPEFTHFDYVNPSASKGGEVVLAAIGSYDSFNLFISDGITPSSLGLLYDSLTTQSLDEPFTEYGLIAESIEIPADNSYVQYTLRNNSHWHDGIPITTDDVVFSFETLISQGDPHYRSYYESVTAVEKIDNNTVKFSFSGETNNELPLIMGQLAIIPKHYWENRDFTKTTLEPPLGSGPYKIANFDAGRSITYERVNDYWAKGLPVMVGQYNFDKIRYEYFRDY